MDLVSRNISINLKRIRQARRLTLDEVAEQTGVSKSMLGQIERGDSNPTIATVAKIVSGLRVSFNTLIETPRFEPFLVKKSGLTPIKTLEGQYSVINYFPFEENRSFEIYGMEILPEGCYHSGAHGENTYEYLVVHEGTLKLVINSEEIITAEEGDALRFLCDKPHDYINISDKTLILTSFFTFGTKYF